MAHFVNVPADALFKRLEAAGFVRGMAGSEVTYTRNHAQDGRLSVCVYTSCAVQGFEARGCGEDAIRVVALFKWTHRNGPAGPELRTKKLYQAKVLRVTSVDGVLERMINAAREAYAACNEFRKQDTRRPQLPARVVPGPRADATYQRHGYTDDDAVDDWKDRTR